MREKEKDYLRETLSQMLLVDNHGRALTPTNTQIEDLKDELKTKKKEITVLDRALDIVECYDMNFNKKLAIKLARQEIEDEN